ncbi:alpha-1,4-glucan--maltose-1-phosphate maltosyltransferase [Hyphomicrobium sp.]|uniref:alpha-1,4-glucan--maltose-1-phosphate maltosyltransferase n=1 Tax=Hyphomicrobium sp. TaxID=82 RepID=UPI003F6E8AFD
MTSGKVAIAKLVDEPALAPESLARLPERVVIANVSPELDGGRYPVKATAGDDLAVSCDLLTDGHDRVRAVVRHRIDGGAWSEAPLELVGNDRWSASIRLLKTGRFQFTIEAWRDPFVTWSEDARARAAANQDMTVELQVARLLAERAADDAKTEKDRSGFLGVIAAFDAAAGEGGEVASRLALMQSDATHRLFALAGPRPHAVTYQRVLDVRIERRAAAFSAWYELTPRSQSGDAARHGTFADVIGRLPYVRDMGFDVLYLTPIHPIGTTNRKGRNNSLRAEPGEPGSPYAIGSAEGGHDAIHPDLGSMEDFRTLVAAAHAHGLEIALDFAIQCSLDHPWIKEHPDWFDWRPDGSIRYAENPPKRYEDIVNVHFYGDAFPGLWIALRDVVLFWVAQGVKIFRVDNPHTKPFPFWEWLIREVQDADPDVIFLSEAFTRPKIMLHLAKIGFTQSYSYFTWRNTKQELTDYLTELMHGPGRHCMRPNFFVNTPDINPYYLQTGGRPAHRVRLVLAATLGGNYGVNSGFELCEATALPGKEEYADSEKYEIKAWDWDRADHIRDDIRFINGLRRTSLALQQFDNAVFYNAWNDNILYYGKATADKGEFLLFAVNLDPHHAQEADFEVPLWELGLPDHASIEVEDVASGNRFTWTGKVQHMRLDPYERPYVIWRLLAARRAA